MKKNILFALFILSLYLASCGHWEGSNPVGVTGGGVDGYGVSGNAQQGNDDSGGGSITVDSRVFGDWYYYKSGKYYYYSFYEDGDFYLEVGDGYNVTADYDGTYSANGSNMVIRINQTSTTYTYQLQNSKLYLTDSSGQTMILTKL